MMCRNLSVNRSTFYAWQRRPVSKRQETDERILPLIKESHKGSRETYGSLRVTKDLKDAGETVGHNRVAKIMRKNNIIGRPKAKWIATTDSKHSMKVAPNLLNREFTVNTPDKAWVGDITYVWTYSGWVYLATVIDLCGRRVIGWSIDTEMKTALVQEAFDMACAMRGAVKPGLIFHTDRGSQYTSDAFQKTLKLNGAKSSMSRKGNCWDNAVAESFFATIKRELLNRAAWLNKNAVRAAVYEYIEVFYNRKRRHSTNEYISPVDYETLCNKNAAVAA